MGSQMFKVQADDLEALKVLASIVANPKAIAEAHAEARKQIALTEDEEKKVVDAKQLLKEYAARLAVIDDAHTILGKREADINQRQSLKQKELDDLSANLIVKKDTLDGQENNLKLREKKLQEDRQKHSQSVDALNDKQRKIDEQEKSLNEKLEALKKITG